MNIRLTPKGRPYAILAASIALAFSATTGERAHAAEESAADESEPAEETVSEQPPTDGEDAAAPADPSPATDESDTDTATTTATTTADQAAEVFVPSEDISEDISVPFPVDI